MRSNGPRHAPELTVRLPAHPAPARGADVRDGSATTLRWRPSSAVAPIDRVRLLARQLAGAAPRAALARRRAADAPLVRPRAASGGQNRVRVTLARVAPERARAQSRGRAHLRRLDAVHRPR